MDDSKFCLSWDAYQTNICRGLSALQQNGEFVDMTLAADGHYVKVHQMIMSLVSPYIKELITAANCSHPVIFLNQMSYNTLCLILEYIYTGEVQLRRDNVMEVLQAAKALHIRGLFDMPVADNLLDDPLRSNGAKHDTYNTNSTSDNADINETMEGEDRNSFQHFDDALENSKQDLCFVESHKSAVLQKSTNITKQFKNAPVLQYTLSNQGGLQLLLNRFIYCLRYSGKNLCKRWRCVEYNRKKCSASVITRGETIVKRISSHNHPFHDDKILKRTRCKLIYSAIADAEIAVKNKDYMEIKEKVELTSP